MLYKPLQKLFIPISLVILLLVVVPITKSQTADVNSINVQYSGQSVYTSSTCTEGFCAIAFTDISDTKYARVIFFGSSILTDALNVPANDVVLVAGKNNILVSTLDANSIIKNYIIDSSGTSKTLQDSSPNRASKVQITYDIADNRFLISYQFSNSTTSTTDINGFLIDGTTGSKIGDDFNIIKDVWSLISAGYDKIKNKFIIGYVKQANNQYPLYIVLKDVGYQPATPPVEPLLTLSAYNAVSSLYRDSDNSHVITTFDTSGIHMAAFAVGDSETIIKKTAKFRPLTGIVLTSTATSLDPVNNRMVMVYDRGDATRKDTYIQIVDPISLDNSEGEKTFNSPSHIINSPSIFYINSIGAHILTYANKTTGSVQSKFIDSTGKTIVFKAYTGPSDTVTSQYEVIDQTTKNKLVTGSRGYKDSIILLKHPTYGERIVATLEFSKTNPNLSNLAIDATANATAVNKNSVTGLGQNVFLVVPNRNNWAGIRACPQVVKVKDIVAGCSGEILFRGPNFPQTNGSVTVSASTIDQKEVYGVSGLTGSGVALLEEPVTPLKQKLKAIVSTLFDYVGQSNNTVVVSANYTFNSTSIPSALCAISYSDELLQQHPMTFSSSLYKHSRIFTTDPSTNNFTVSCSHENYTTEISISSLFKNMTENQQTEPKLTLMNPSGQQSSSSLDFDCALVGQGTKEVSLYTNISGIWKKEETKQVTQSPSTVKFHLNDLQNGVYLWNCGAKTASGIVYFSVQNKSFEVKTDVTQSPEPVESESPPNCNPVDDCTEWEPNSCPQNQTQKRTCQNTDVCGYPETNSCIYIVESNSTQQSNITQLPVTTKNKGGFDWLTIILIIVIIVISLVVFIMIKRRSSSVEESEEPYSEEGFGDQGEYGDQGSGTQ